MAKVDGDTIAVTGEVAQKSYTSPPLGFFWDDEEEPPASFAYTLYATEDAVKAALRST